MEKNYEKSGRTYDRKGTVDFLDPAYLDEDIIRIVRSHMTTELYANNDLIMS